MNRFNKGVVLAIVLFAPVAMWAQVDHIDVVEVDNGGIVKGKTYRVYAVMESPGDIIDAVYGEAMNPLLIESTKPFFQHMRGGAMSSEVQRYDTREDASLLYDSWVTIGAEDNYMNSLNTFLADFSTFEEGGSIETADGAWFVTPDKRQSFADDQGRILILQLTTEGEVTGLINIHGRTVPIFDADGQGAFEEIKSNGLTFKCGGK
jgi:hypothetical protein